MIEMCVMCVCVVCMVMINVFFNFFFYLNRGEKLYLFLII